MAGRGMNMVMPAWMQRGGSGNGSVPGMDSPAARSNAGDQPRSQVSSADYGQPGAEYGGHGSSSRHSSARHDDDRGDRYSRSHRSHDSRRSRDDDRYRERSRRRSRSSGRRSSRPSRHESREDSAEREQRRKERRARRQSNFDVPPEAAQPVSIPLKTHNPTAYPPHQTMGDYGGMGASQGGVNISASLQASRHARRLYVGGVERDMSDNDLRLFFNEVIERALHKRQEGGYVLTVYVNHERRFAFVELNSIELTTACMSLDGISYRGHPLKISRPNDYNPDAINPSSVGQIPSLDLSAIGVISTQVPDSPNKIFIGGIPTSLTEQQIMELFSPFGELKAFHLVKDPVTNASRGYAFAEYMDPSVTDSAVDQLNNMPLSDRVLTVRRALPTETAKGAAAMAGSVNAALGVPQGKPAGMPPMMPGMPMMPPMGAPVPGMPGAMPGMPPMPGMPAAGGMSQPPLPPSVPVDECKPTGPPTCVLQMLDMVTDDDLNNQDEYEDIIADIRDECSRYGKVLSISVPKTGTCKGNVFVEFEAPSMAQTCSDNLAGRLFGSSKVKVRYYSEQDYAQGKFKD